jgi:hypothetical protein
MFPGNPQRLRCGFTAAIALLAVGLCAGPSLAQPRFPRPPIGPPQMPQAPNPFNPNRPGLGGPLITHVWTCGKCGKEIGTGNFPPANCPFCGVRLINGIGPANPNGGGNGNMQPPTNNQPRVPNNPGNPNPPDAPNDNPPPIVLQPDVEPNPPPVENPPRVGNFPPPHPQGGPNTPDLSDTNLASASNGRNFMTKVVLGVGAVLVALVVIGVGVGVIVYNITALNRREEPSERPRRRQVARDQRASPSPKPSTPAGAMKRGRDL